MKLKSLIIEQLKPGQQALYELSKTVASYQNGSSWEQTLFLELNQDIKQCSRWSQLALSTKREASLIGFLESIIQGLNVAILKLNRYKEKAFFTTFKQTLENYYQNFLALLPKGKPIQLTLGLNVEIVTEPLILPCLQQSLDKMIAAYERAKSSKTVTKLPQYEQLKLKFRVVPNLQKITLRGARKICGTLGIKQKVRGKDRSLKQMKEAILELFQTQPQRVQLALS